MRAKGSDPEVEAQVLALPSEPDADELDWSTPPDPPAASSLAASAAAAEPTLDPSVLALLEAVAAAAEADERPSRPFERTADERLSHPREPAADERPSRPSEPAVGERPSRPSEPSAAELAAATATAQSAARPLARIALVRRESRPSWKPPAPVLAHEPSGAHVLGSAAATPTRSGAGRFVWIALAVAALASAAILIALNAS